MTVLLFLLSVVAFSTLGEVASLQGKYVYGRNIHSRAELEAAEQFERSAEIQSKAEQNEYHLYTRRNPTSSQNLVKNDVDSIRSSNFNANNPTVVIVHGWLDNMNADFNGGLRDAYLKKSDLNVIVVDWGKIAVALYGYAVSGVVPVGRNVGQFLDFLSKTTGAPFSNMHLVGFSLGAHVVGNAGRELNGQVARITGLDPAGPLWSYNSNRLKSSDAVYVEAIHSDGGLVGLGIGTAVANADFFPNGGTSQPGCNDNFCNHNRAWEFFAATVTYDHLLATRCDNTVQLYSNNCSGSTLKMGNNDLNKRGSGLYRVDTDKAYPF